MALEPAGVSLQAQGFSDYLKKLDQTEKKQREVFDAEFKGTGKTFAQISKAAKDYENQLRKTEQEQKKAEQAAKKLADTQAKEAEKAAKAQIKAAQKAALEQKKLAAAQKTAAATQRQAFISTGQAALAFTKQVAQAAFEIGKLGAQFQGQQIGLNNLAGSFNQSGKGIQKAIVDASKGTLSGLQAINAANQGLLLGVAKTPEEFANLTNSALTLGRTLGLDATQSIEQFTSALGRQSLLILDNFGISAKQVNAEIERLAQADFGKARSELTEAQKQATFMKAALNIAGEAAATIGEEAGEAQAAFDRLTASSQNFKTELGIALSNLNQSLGITDTITGEINQITDAFKLLRGSAEDAGIDEQIEAAEIRLKGLQQTLEDTRAGLEEGGGLFGTGLLEGFLSGLDESAIEGQTRAIADLQAEIDALNLEKAAEDQKKFNNAAGDTPPIIEDNTKAIEALQSAIKQAQQLQLSFARSAEDAARKQARATEDLAIKQARAIEDTQRKQAQQVAKLASKQAKDRDKLLDRQVKSREKFEARALKQIRKAEESAAKERRKASDDRLKAQKQTQDKLRQQEESFRLSQLQGERRFQLADRRLRAEGDILGLQQLREDRELQRQEEKENFDLSQKETKKDGDDSLKEQDKNLRARQKERQADINNLKADLESQRSEQLSNFDQQLADLERQQAEARAQLQAGFAEQAAQRAIALQREEEDRARALQREEEDRRISQRRQLEDLGQSLAEQKDVTAQGVNAIAEEIEKIFGLDGVANNIIVGFSERTRSEFDDLTSAVEDDFKKIQGIQDEQRDKPLVALTGDTRRGEVSSGGFGGRIQRFDDGGIVDGPIGSPQAAIVHAGETVLPTHQRSFAMAAPVIPSQSLDVVMSGGFSVTGDGQGNEEILRAASEEMTENFRIAVQRLARRN
jgi:hypothetical protein